MTFPVRRNWLWPLVKWGLCVLVLAFVVRRGYQLWDPDEFRSIPVQFSWLILGGGAYLAGWLPSIWFWRKLLAVRGEDVSWPVLARAYFCGHLGKYVPGKAGVLIIRGGLLKLYGCSARTAALTAAYETLGMIAAGMAVAAALAPLILTDSQWQNLPAWIQAVRQHPGLAPAIVMAVTLLALPVISIVFTRVATKMAPAGAEGNTPAIGKIDTKLIAVGLLVFVLGWGCHGLSLGCTVRAVSTSPFDWSQWPAWTGIVSLATAIGFLAVFAPGGVGVREGLLIEMLRIQPDVNAQQAVAAALLLRIVWFAAEIVAASGLYYGVSAVGQTVPSEPEIPA